MSATSLIGFIINGDFVEEIFEKFAENPSEEDKESFNLENEENINLMALEELEDDNYQFLSIGYCIYAGDGGVNIDKLNSAWDVAAKFFVGKGLTEEEAKNWGLTKDKIVAISASI